LNAEKKKIEKKLIKRKILLYTMTQMTSHKLLNISVSFEGLYRKL